DIAVAHRREPWRRQLQHNVALAVVAGSNRRGVGQARRAARELFDRADARVRPPPMGRRFGPFTEAFGVEIRHATLPLCSCFPLLAPSAPGRWPGSLLGGIPASRSLASGAAV